MKKLLLLLCVALVPTFPAVGKEIPAGSDIAIVSDEEIAAARDARVFPSTHAASIWM